MYSIYFILSKLLISVFKIIDDYLWVMSHRECGKLKIGKIY